MMTALISFTIIISCNSKQEQKTANHILNQYADSKRIQTLGYHTQQQTPKENSADAGIISLKSYSS